MIPDKVAVAAIGVARAGPRRLAPGEAPPRHFAQRVALEQVAELEVFTAGVEALVAAEARAAVREPRWNPDAPVSPLAAYAEAIETALAEEFGSSRPHILIEPGRYLDAQ